MTPELLRKWRCGYLPHSARGLLRGKFIYPMLSEDGEVLTWFGRDVEYERKRAKWEQSGRDTEKEPRKHQFVRGFHRGLELFGQQRSRLDEPGYRELIRELGVLIVEGPNDVVRLDALGVSAFGLCSNHITGEQVVKLKRWADELSDGMVTVMLDNDPEGVNGAKQALYEIAQHTHVRLAWSPAMFDGKYRGKQPESLSEDEWTVIRKSLVMSKK